MLQFVTVFPPAGGECRTSSPSVAQVAVSTFVGLLDELATEATLKPHPASG